MPESVLIKTVLARAYTTQVLSPWYLPKKWFPAVAHSAVRISNSNNCEFETEFEKNVKVNRGPNGVDC
jgi:hypothetical protein